jgi:hypothetical protein
MKSVGILVQVDAFPFWGLIPPQERLSMNPVSHERNHESISVTFFQGAANLLRTHVFGLISCGWVTVFMNDGRNS